MLNDFILRYPNSLLGKHFKILQQVAVFQLYDGVCPPLVFDLWKATGELGAVLWFHKIENLDEYLADLKIYIANLLDIWATVDPNRIIVKQKLHVLVHLIENIRRHGPAVLYSTEIFDHDIARRMAGIELFKHQVSGGWWLQEDTTTAAGRSNPRSAPDPPLENLDGCPTSPSSYTRAGENVRNFLQQHPALQRRLGWVSPLVLTPGTVKLLPSKLQAPCTWLSARGTAEIPTPVGLSKPTECLWYSCKYLIARSRDICKPGSWIFFCDGAGVSHAGRISKILSCMEEKQAVAIVDRYNIDTTRDPYFNMPVLHRACDPEGHGLSTQIPVQSVSFIFNAQHDCRACKCIRLEDQRIRQERTLTERTRKVLMHEPTDRYLVNMHALHNAALIRSILPRTLTAPIAYVADREAHHKERSAAMRVSGPLKRAEAQAKAAETRARNKTAKDGEARGVD
ncbi:hypothetical protein C2E23DRAFT_888770 [Lenzites betulinus]|nr:hypothetical protein C2E23DRAFT_888770 [Lenzites betulinus]